MQQVKGSLGQSKYFYFFVYHKHSCKNGQTNENTSLYSGKENIMHAGGLLTVKSSRDGFLDFQNIQE